MFIFAVIVMLNAGCSNVPGNSPPPQTASALTRQPVIGDLGLPLGTITEIRATIVAGRELRMKEYENRYLLRVTDVGGQALAEPRVLKFTSPAFVNVHLARDSFSLHELKTGTTTGRLDSEQIAKLEEGYVGKQVRLVVYETGGYSGIPANLPDDVLSWQDRGFGFSTWLEVHAERRD